MSTAVDTILLTVVAAREGQRTAGMLFLGQTEQVCRETDLGLYFFLAVTEIVIRQQCNDNAGRIAGGQLEGLAVVIEFVSPASSTYPPALPVCGIAPSVAGRLPSW